MPSEILRKISCLRGARRKTIGHIKILDKASRPSKNLEKVLRPEHNLGTIVGPGEKGEKVLGSSETLGKVLRTQRESEKGL